MNRLIQEAGKRKEEAGLVLLKKPVQRADTGQVVREGSTGSIVFVAATAPAATQVKGKLLMLPRVWAVAAAADEVQRLQPLPPFDEGAVVGGVAGEVVPIGDVLPIAEPAPDADTIEVHPVEAPPVELAFYRKYTEAMLRRYVRLSMAVGRVPSLLGRELFRGHVSSYRMTNFEDVVVFCFDMEKLLGRMRGMDQQMIKRIGMQEYKHQEAASMMRISLRTCTRTYGQAIDRLTEMLLEAGMLETLKG